MLSLARKLWHRGQRLVLIEGFYFDRPLVLLQSDDWGRVGLRDHEGLELLKAAGLDCGERPYDFYTLEQAEDVTSLFELLLRHRDSNGRSACVGMNFITANVDFAAAEKCGFRAIRFRPLADGFPEGWVRPGLLEAYRRGIEDGVFYPALHGHSHFCQAAVLRYLSDAGERGQLLRTLWRAGTPYIHWRMPWVGYEYWDPELSREKRFLSSIEQAGSIRHSAEMFFRLFSHRPLSACAPGYRANRDTHKAWMQQGIQVAQNGPQAGMHPHVDREGLLNLYRTIDFEPGDSFSMEECLRKADESIARGVPLIVSVHSINFHSSVRNFRDPTLRLLDQFLSKLESKYPNLLYLHDGDLRALVDSGFYESQGRVNVGVRKLKLNDRNGAAESQA
ncbi:MAG: hypothetical protein ABJA69_10435 [Acidobacteriaceae bacterium]